MGLNALLVHVSLGIIRSLKKAIFKMYIISDGHQSNESYKSIKQKTGKLYLKWNLLMMLH